MLFAYIDMMCLCINTVLIFVFFVRCGDAARITMIVDCRGRNRTIVNGRGNRNDRRWSCTQSDDSRWSWYPRSRSMTAHESAIPCTCATQAIATSPHSLVEGPIRETRISNRPCFPTQSRPEPHHLSRNIPRTQAYLPQDNR